MLLPSNSRWHKLLAVWLVSAFALTLFPYGPWSAQPQGASWGGTSFDLWANVFFFVPMGVLATYASWRKRRILLAAALLTLCIETIQMWLPMRCPTFIDLIANTSGAALGIMLAPRLRGLYTTPMQCAALLIAVTLVLAGAAWVPHVAHLSFLYPAGIAILLALVASGLLGVHAGYALALLGGLAVTRSLQPLWLATIACGAALGAWPLEVRPSGPATRLLPSPRTSAAARIAP